jgi:pimeloyl-ACP methyl ester carboxylesterase
MVAAHGLHVEAHGAGPALVLAHGFGGSARNWRPQLRTQKNAYAICV